MIKRLKRIAPLKFGLVIGLLYGLISLVFIPFILLSVGVSLLAPQHTTNGLGQGLGIVFALLMCVVFPVLYAVMGGLLGMLMAWLYNVIASWIGGIEFEVE